MILDVDPLTGVVELLDPDLLTRFHIAVHKRAAGDLSGVDETVDAAGVGRVSGEEVLVSLDWVRRRGQAIGVPDWDSQLDAMVAFSISRGWVEDRPTADGTVPSLRVHCEWPREPKFAALGFTRTALREGRVRVGAERHLSPDVIAHLPGAPTVTGVDDVVRSIGQGGTQLEVCHVIADGDLAAVHSVHTRDAATAERLVDLYRCVEGRIVEWWRTGPVG